MEFDRLAGHDHGYLQMMDPAAIRELLAKAAARLELQSAIGGVARKGVLGIPPAPRLGQGREGPAGRDMDRDGLFDLEALRYCRFHLGRGRSGDERGECRRPQKSHTPCSSRIAPTSRNARSARGILIGFPAASEAASIAATARWTAANDRSIRKAMKSISSALTFSCCRSANSLTSTAR